MRPDVIAILLGCLYLLIANIDMQRHKRPASAIDWTLFFTGIALGSFGTISIVLR